MIYQIENPKRERYVATLIGGALGDILGKPIEGWKREQIKKYVGKIEKPISPFVLRNESGEILENDEFGKVKFYSKDLSIGDYTDDTILTLALADSIAERKGFDLEDIARKQVYEYIIRKMDDGTVFGGFGGTTIEAFKNLEKGLSPLESGIIGGPGNAPAMKMSPLGLYIDAKKDLKKGIYQAELIGKITHLDPRSIVSGVIQAAAVYYLLGDISRKDFLGKITDICEEYEKPLTEKFSRYADGSLLSRMDWIEKNRDATTEKAFEELGADSLVYRSYPFAIFMFQKYWNDPITGMIETVNFGGDCDTTAAMFGALAGAKNGMVFPDGWVDIINDKKRIARVGCDIYNIGDGKNGFR